jgi:hypothetical protein
MIGTLAVRSLLARPVRSAVLAAGFGLGVGVMAILLGVAEIVLEQAQAPALAGGGDVVVRVSPEVPARLLLAGTLQSDALRPRIRAAAPFHSAGLYLVQGQQVTRVAARGGIPSLERLLDDAETASVEGWRDSPADVAWTADTPERVLRHIDRFHPVPDVPRWKESWAEWLYFNGRAPGARFYLTFLVGPRLENGRRAAGVRLQLDRGGGLETFGAGAEVTEASAMQAPDLTIGASAVRLDGMQYRIALDLEGEQGRRVRGELTIEASPGRLVPPVEISGARGWRTGYVVPVTSGRLDGELTVAGERVALQGGVGYHDHNWGFWEGVSWQWGQVQHGDLSLIYGRVLPPPDAADPERLPGFVGALGPDGPIGYATDVQIAEENDARGRPREISVRGRGAWLELELRFVVESAVATRMTQGPLSTGLDFLQMRGQYSVTGRAADRELAFTAPGAAETFRGGGPGSAAWSVP